MGNIFKQDFREFVQALNDCEVRYILVGGFSVILYGYARTTGDMDIWVERSPENYIKIKQAFLSFGMPLFDMTEKNFLEPTDLDVFTFGRPPTAIDMMINVKGLDFNTSFEKAVYFEDDGLKIKTIHLNDLLTAKRSAARPKDMDDIENLSNKNDV
jgi:predicted nucleotidyltransferase